MANDAVKVLLVDDDEDEFVLTRDLLADYAKDRFSLDWTSDYHTALADMARDEHQVYLLDYRLGAFDGLELLREALSQGCSAPVIMLTGRGDGEVDVAAMSSGAADYLIKSRLNGEILERAMRHALERKRMEKQLAREREDFVAMLTHDIKGPLHVILGVADMLLDEIKCDSGHSYSAPLQNLIDNALTINSLVANYLDFAKMKSGGVSLVKQTLSVDEILARLCQRFHASAQRRDLTLELALADELPPVRGDPLAMERVFTNLLSNALKFTPSGGRVTISARPCKHAVAVSVTNTGPGIPSDEISGIFEKYQRARSSKNKDGTGLGLYIVKSLVEAHGGRIGVESTPGRETRFEVNLPAG